MRAAIVLAILMVAGSAQAATFDSLADEAAAGAAKAAAEMGAGDVAVTVRRPGKVGKVLTDRLVRSLGKVVLLPDADRAAVRKAGFGVWIEAELQVDAKNVSIVVRVRRLGIRWKDLLGPTSRWSRAFVVVRPLDAELRRALGVAPAGPRLFARPRRMELDLGAPVLALASTDLDGDGAAELIALTSDEVVLLEARKTALVAKQRVALAGAAPLPRPREPVGTLVAVDLDGDGVDEIVARSSEHAEGARLSWRKGQLVDEGGGPDYPMCAVGGKLRSMALASGRNTFVLPKLPAVVGAACAADGRVATVEPGGKLSLGELTMEGIGAAFALADLDGDRAPELIASAHRAPGDGDLLAVYGLADAKKPELLWKSDTLSGGIVAVTSGDTDGDGAPDVVFATRLVGSTRTDVWIVR